MGNPRTEESSPEHTKHTSGDKLTEEQSELTPKQETLEQLQKLADPQQTPIHELLETPVFCTKQELVAARKAQLQKVAPDTLKVRVGIDSAAKNLNDEDKLIVEASNRVTARVAGAYDKSQKDVGPEITQNRRTRLSRVNLVATAVANMTDDQLVKHYEKKARRESTKKDATTTEPSTSQNSDLLQRVVETQDLIGEKISVDQITILDSRPGFEVLEAGDQEIQNKITTATENNRVYSNGVVIAAHTETRLKRAQQVAKDSLQSKSPGVTEADAVKTGAEPAQSEEVEAAGTDPDDSNVYARKQRATTVTRGRDSQDSSGPNQSADRQADQAVQRTQTAAKVDSNMRRRAGNPAAPQEVRSNHEQSALRKRISDAFDNQLHTTVDIQRRMMEESKKEKINRIVQQLISDFDKIVKSELPLSGYRLFQPIYDPGNEESTYIGQIIRFAGTNRVKVEEAINYLAELRYRKSQEEDSNIYLNPLNSLSRIVTTEDWELFSEKFLKEPGMFTPDDSGQLLYTVKGFKSRRLARYRIKAEQEFQEQFIERNGETLPKDIMVTEKLTLQCMSAIRDQDTNETKGYIYTGFDNQSQKNYRVQVDSSFHFVKFL